MNLSKIKILFIIIISSMMFSCNQKQYTYEKKSNSDSDLTFFLVRDGNANLEYKVYFDSKNEKSAQEAIPHLNKIYRELLKFHITNEVKMKWYDVAFVNDTNYIAPISETSRWVLQNHSGKLSQRAEKKLYNLIGHEQVHAWQKQFSTCDDLPKWFVEGQAVWSESKVTRNLRPKIFEDALNKRKKDFDKVMNEEDKLNLVSWGGVIVKRESIRKQLSPEGQKYFDKNGKTPPGATFSITPDMMTKDNVNQPARYYGSYLIFKKLEEKMGVEKLKKWIYYTVTNTPCDNESIVRKLKKEFGIDITNELN